MANLEKLPKYAFGLAAILVLFLAYYIHLMNGPLTNDESIYISAGAFATKYTLYKDFFHNHGPVYPLVLAQIFRFVDEGYLHIARLLTSILATCSVMVFFMIARRISHSWIAAWAISLLLVTSTVMLRVLKTARNDALALFLLLVGLLLVLEALSRTRNKSVLYVISGIFFGLAVGTRINFAYFPAIVFLYINFVEGRTLKYNLKTVSGPFVAGGLIGMLPVLYYFMMAGEVFIDDVFSFNILTSEVYYAGKSMFSYKIGTFLKIIGQDVILAAFVFTGVAFVAAIPGAGLRAFGQSFHRQRGFLFVGLLMIGIPVALIPNPTYHQYINPLVIPALLLMAAAWGAAAITLKIHRAQEFMWLAIVILACKPGFLGLVEEALLFSREANPVANVRKAAHEIQDILTDCNLKGKVGALTFFPAAEAGMVTYKEFSGAEFLYRMEDHIGEKKFSAMKGVPRQHLDDFFKNDQPAAILLWDDPSEAGLLNHARTHGYFEINKKIANRLRLYLAPGSGKCNPTRFNQ
ncbi:MAG: glycosyltransferase family 39 protein [Magnetococcus sp. DMHC-1]|nr:glycosyltransferase family 39 protein [Magnetococcales bacterium]